MSDIIVIPARYGSKRLPGKPLIKIAGISLLQRVISIAIQAKSIISDLEVVVATDDERIAAHCDELNVKSVITSTNISSGSERALATCEMLNKKPEFIINLQGDAPFITPECILQMITVARKNKYDVTTPIKQLSWDELESLRAQKKETPFSGTTCVRSDAGQAYWFSKNIIPAIRSEDKLRESGDLSPVFQHIGLYCYRYDVLKRYQNTIESSYEILEGLEQLRLLQMGVGIQTVMVESGKNIMSGIDSPLDLEKAENFIEKHGDPYVQW